MQTRELHYDQSANADAIKEQCRAEEHQAALFNVQDVLDESGQGVVGYNSIVVVTYALMPNQTQSLECQ